MINANVYFSVREIQRILDLLADVHAGKYELTHEDNRPYLI